MKKTVIITKGISADAQSHAKAYPEANIIFADSNPVPEVLVKMGKYIQLPNPSSSSFIHILLKYCLDYNADILVLLSPRELEIISSQKQLFEEYNIQLIWYGSSM